MRILSVLAISWLYISIGFSQVSYCDAYPDGCAAFERFCTRRDTTIRRIVEEEMGYSSAALLCIVAPEVARYSTWRDKLETGTVELFYVQMGGKYGQFSIGSFQMKPFFVERLEQTVTQYRALERLAFVARYDTEDAVSIRRARVNRIKDVRWQLYYLCAFYGVMEQMYPASVFSSYEEQLRFYGAAYNRGFWEPMPEIKRWQDISSFPDKKADIRFPYATVVAEIFQKTQNNH